MKIKLPPFALSLHCDKIILSVHLELGWQTTSFSSFACSTASEATQARHCSQQRHEQQYVLTGCRVVLGRYLEVSKAGPGALRAHQRQGGFQEEQKAPACRVPFLGCHPTEA